ncbi:MAG: cytochrome c biogenesis protein [Syntrophorhabdales bacterium]|jgi:ABC-type transport system involved in cytochrome c biogenesis permease subunit
MTWNDKLLGIVMLVYLALFVIHLIYFATKKAGVLGVMWALLIVAFGLHSVGLAGRWVESYSLGIGHAPLSNFYESLIFYAWCIALVLIVMKKRLVSVPLITMFATLTAVLFMAYASLSPSVDRRIQPLIPALQSNWLHVHVFTCFIAYASFAISFLCGLLYMFKPKAIPAEKLEELNYQSIMVGFPMLTAGILTGAVWAHYAWGAYWSWDPKETWSLITWIVYALFLHARLTRGWKGRRIALLSIIGFMSVIFTYLGVNFILAGLHSYGAS